MPKYLPISFFLIYPVMFFVGCASNYVICYIFRYVICCLSYYFFIYPNYVLCCLSHYVLHCAPHYILYQTYNILCGIYPVKFFIVYPVTFFYDILRLTNYFFFHFLCHGKFIIQPIVFSIHLIYVLHCPPHYIAIYHVMFFVV